MKHLDLLGTDLKSEFLCDLFETYDVKVVYEYDRTHENIADEYRAELPNLGLEFVFDENLLLRTLFMKPVEVATYNPLEDDDRIQRFGSKSEARKSTEGSGITVREGAGNFMGEKRDWIRFECEACSIHYEFIDSALHMITLQTTSETNVSTA